MLRVACVLRSIEVQPLFFVHWFSSGRCCSHPRRLNLVTVFELLKLIELFELFKLFQ